MLAVRIGRDDGGLRPLVHDGVKACFQRAAFALVDGVAHDDNAFHLFCRFKDGAIIQTASIINHYDSRIAFLRD